MLFGEKRIKKSFKNAKKDVLGLKNSMNEWILFLNSNQREMKRRILELEKRVSKMETERFQDLRNF